MFGLFSAVLTLKTSRKTSNTKDRITKKTPYKPRRSESGNIFFTLFGAVVVVGLLGTVIMSTMRGPLSTMVQVQSRTKAESEMAIASRLAMLEAIQLPAGGDCDGDGYIEPVEFKDAGTAGPIGGGFLPDSIASSHVDPWGVNYGYCIWDPGSTTGDALCDVDATGTNERLDGNGIDGDETYSVIALISAGPDQVFDTNCIGGISPSITRGGDDLLVEYTYADANEATGGLWSLAAGDPATATIDKNIDVEGGGKFGAGIDLTSSSAALQLGAASMTFPNEATLPTCNAANDGLIRINSAADPDTLELCDDPTGWVVVGGSVWVAGAGNDIYYNSGTAQVGIGNNSPAHTLDVTGTANITGATTLGSTLGVTGATTLGGTLGVTGTSTLGALNAGATSLSSTLNVTGTSTLGVLNAGATSLSSTLGVTGGTTLSTLVATGTADIQGNISDSLGDLTLNDDVDITGGLDVTGNISAANITATTNLTADNNVIVNGDTLGPPAHCASDELLLWTNGSGWSCEAIQAGLDNLDTTGAGNGDCIVYNSVSGNWEAGACTGGGGSTNLGIFEVASNVIRVKSGSTDYAADDFVIGSSQLADDGGTTDDNARMFFDKSKAAFRVGSSNDGGMWDDANIGNYSFASNYQTTASGAYSIAMGQEASASGINTMAIGLGDATASAPDVSGTRSLGIFMGDHDNVTFAADNTFGIFGGALIIDPATPATQLAAASGEQTLELDVAGDIGADHYCDSSGNNCFASTDVGSGLWTDLGGSRIHYGTTGAEQVGIGTNNPQATLDVNGGVRVGSVTGSTPLFMELDDLDDVDAATPAANDCIVYNDGTGNWEAGACSSGGTASAAGANRQIQFNDGGTNLGADANFVYTAAGDFIVGSYQLDDTTTGNEDYRMFFDVSKGAFRAGNVHNDRWDDDNVANHSTAFGENTQASGTASFAAGTSVIASANYATAFGASNSATGEASFATGIYNDATGHYSIAMGQGNTASNTWHSNDTFGIAMGRNNTASGIASIAMGLDTITSGRNSMALGLGNATTTAPEVSGDKSLGIFMDNQDAVVFNDPNTMGLFGGSLLVDPAVPATQLTARSSIDFGAATDAIILPSGTDAQQPGQVGQPAVAAGMFRYNTTDTAIEFHNGTSWISLDGSGGTASAAGANRQIQFNDGGTNLGADANFVYTADGGFMLGTTTFIPLPHSKEKYQFVTDGDGDSDLSLGQFIGSTAGAKADIDLFTARGTQAVPATMIDGDWLSFIRYQAYDGNSFTSRASIGAVINGTVSDETVPIDLLFKTSPGDNMGTERMRIKSDGDITLSGTGALKLHAGTTAEQPTTPVAGMFRYNTTDTAIEFHNGTSWISLDGSGGTASAAGANRQIQFNDGGTNLGADANFVYTAAGDFIVGSYQLDDTTTGSEDYRMFFDVSKGAFRAGVVDDDEWNSGHVGDRSFAGGFRTTASGNRSTAFGSNTTASAMYSFAAGANAQATHSAAIALGNGAKAQGENSFATGFSTLASNDGATAMGARTTASGHISTTFGNEVTASGDHSMAIGLGDASTTNRQVSGNNSLGIFMGDQDGVNVTQANTMAIMGGNVGIGNIAPDVELDITGDVEYSGTLNGVSDRRLKENIKPLTKRGALIEKIKKINTYSFTMKDDEDHRTAFGVIAQELETIFPELVRTAKDEMGTKSVNYVGLIAPMIEATKELKAENDALRGKLAAMHKTQEQTQAALSSLSAQVSTLNKLAGRDINKASLMPPYLWVLLALMGGFGLAVIMRRKA